VKKIILSTFFLASTCSFAGTVNKTCVVKTVKDNICITSSDLKAFYEDYKNAKIKEVGKGNWYFTLADLIEATKTFAFEKILVHEALKSGVENKPIFKNYEKEIKKGNEEIDAYVNNLLKSKKITEKQAEILKKKLKRKLFLAYVKKAYLESILADYLKVTSKDIESFMDAHKGKYGFKKDSKHPKMKIVSKKELVEAIREEKRTRAANRFGQWLWNEYGVSLNTDMLKKLDKQLNGGG